MKTRPDHDLSKQKKDKLKKAIVLEWFTIGSLLVTTTLIYFAMGGSQAMKTAWIDGALGLIPPIAFLIAIHFRSKSPNQKFPYGYKRAPNLSFIVASMALVILGLFILYDSSMSLISMHHPSLGHFYLFGTPYMIWEGWIMVAVLAFSMIPSFVLGHLKMPYGEDLHEKTLYADATMNKASWKTAGTAIIGILGIGLGLWWADAAAAVIISLDLLKDGVTNVKRSMADLSDQRPTSVKKAKPLGLDYKIRDEIFKLDYVKDVDARLREEGHVVTGDVFVVLSDETNTAEKIRKIANLAGSVDWRLHDLVVMPMEEIKERLNDPS